jgi:hypothetical protein
MLWVHGVHEGDEASRATMTPASSPWRNRTYQPGRNSQERLHAQVRNCPSVVASGLQSPYV